MRIKLLLLLLLLFPFFAQSQTYIKHNELISGEWTVKNSPYIIEGVARIRNGETLIIKPGVQIQLNHHDEPDYNKAFARGSIVVDGTLKAIGSKDSLILFTGNSIGWGSVYFKYSSKSEMNYCIVEKSKGIYDLGIKENDARGAITIEDCSPKINNISINNSYIGIFIKGSSFPVISNSMVQNCVHCAIFCFKGSKPEISNTLMAYCKFGLRCEASHPNITNCNIINNMKCGLVVKNHSTLSISNSILWGNPVLFEEFQETTIVNSIIQTDLDYNNKSKYQIPLLKEKNIIGVPNEYPNFNQVAMRNNQLCVNILQDSTRIKVGICTEKEILNEYSNTKIKDIEIQRIVDTSIPDVYQNLPFEENNKRIKKGDILFKLSLAGIVDQTLPVLDFGVSYIFEEKMGIQFKFGLPFTENGFIGQQVTLEYQYLFGRILYVSVENGIAITEFKNSMYYYLSELNKTEIEDAYTVKEEKMFFGPKLGFIVIASKRLIFDFNLGLALQRNIRSVKNVDYDPSLGHVNNGFYEWGIESIYENNNKYEPRITIGVGVAFRL
jgi:parallel beta-helix repeat protein